MAGRGAGDRADRPFDGRPRVAERLSLQRRSLVAVDGAARVHAWHSAHRRAARAGRDRGHRSARAAAETRGFARALSGRSAGIQDLGRGYLVDEDWADQDPEAFFKQAGSEIPFLARANHYFVCATVPADADAPAGRVVGDLLVLRPSAWGQRRRGERLRFPVEHYHHVGGAHHFDLLGHPAIYAQISTWLARRPAPALGIHAGE